MMGSSRIIGIDQVNGVLKAGPTHAGRRMLSVSD